MSSTTADKLNYVLGTKEEIRQAIIEKYVDVPTSATFRSYADSIRAIPTGNKMCRFVIGTKTAGWTEKDCDYLCTGNDDQEVLNEAIQALPETGGEIKVLDGSYNITAPINIDKEKVTLSGCGQSTIFKRMWNADVIEGVIQLYKGYSTFKNFGIDGNRHNYKGAGISIKESNLTDFSFDALSLINNYYGAHAATGSANGFVKGCTFNGNVYHCFYTNTGENWVFANNLAKDSGYGLTAFGTPNSVIIANIVKNIQYNSIKVSGENSVISGNLIHDFTRGLEIVGLTKSTVIGNTVLRGSGTSADYTSSQHTIHMNSNTTDCIVIGNNCSGKPPTVAGTGNIVENNLS